MAANPPDNLTSWRRRTITRASVSSRPREENPVEAKPSNEATMANIQSAKKRARKTVRQTAVNRGRINRTRSFVKKVEEAIGAGDRDAASAALKAAQPELMRAAAKGVMHRNTASRKISRLSAKIKAL